MLAVMQYYKSLAPSKRPKNKSYERLLKASEDPLTKAKLEFFSFVASKMEPFLTFFQEEAPLVPFLHESLMDVLRSILGLVLKPTVIESLKTLSGFSKIDLTNDSNYLKVPQCKIGFSSRDTLSNLLRQDKISEAAAYDFREDCKTFISQLAINLKDRIALFSVPLRCSSAFSPTFMLKSPKLAISRLNRLTDHAGELHILKPQDVNNAQEEYLRLVKEPKLSLFDVKKHRLDTFFFETLDIAHKYPSCAQVLKMVCVMSHGQAAVERGFSHNKTVVDNNICELSVVSKRLVKDFMVAKKLKPASIPITDEIVRFAKGAHVKYDIYTKEESKKKKRALQDTAKQNINADIIEMELRKSVLIKSMESLRVDAASKYALAETTNKVTHCIAGNALSRRADELQKDINEVQACIESAKQKKLSL